MSSQGTNIEVFDNLSDAGMMPFFKNWSWIENPDNHVTIDFSGVSFIAPWAVTLYAAYALLLKSKGKNVTIKINENTTVGSYLYRAGFGEIFDIQTSSSDESTTVRTSKLKVIKNNDDIRLFIQSVMQLLSIGDEEIEGAIQYSLIELLRNVVQHSRSSIGGVVMAQHNPNTGMVELVVADVGIGIQKTLLNVYPEIKGSHLKAIKLATQPHISGTFEKGAYNRMHENAGLGLFFIKQIVTLSGGEFFLASGDSIINIWGNEEGQQHKKEACSQKGGWPGTFAVIQLQNNTIAEFDAVLTTCRSAAEAARKNPSELSLDFIEEIPEMDGLEIFDVAEFNENVDEASRVRENKISPLLNSGKFVILDFACIRFATQSFIHALMYKLLRDNKNIATGLSIANCTKSTREAILAVAGYAHVNKESGKTN